MNKEYEIIIGLEVHLIPKTKSKMFSAVSTDYFAKPANHFVTPVELGLPGALPVPNKEAIRKCVKLALALNCKINQKSKFDRKNYFYPDLPKGYQISQYDLPFGYKGFIEIDVDGDAKRFRITRIHLEEDTGKSMHEGDMTLLDYNKAGMPLIELVTEPEFRNVNEVLVFAKDLRNIVRYLDIGDADMEKGQMRFELNMSLREIGQSKLPKYKVEVKNLGSISVLEKVIAYEYKRQKEILDKGETPIQETRGVRDMSGKTYSQRVKEDADDYRYFPEPDIPPVILSDEFLAQIKNSITELPHEKKSRYINDFRLEPASAEVITASKKRAEWFELAVKDKSDKKLIKEISKWMIGDLFGLLKVDKAKLSDLKFAPTELTGLVEMLQSGKLSGSLAKQVLAEMYKTGKSARDIVKDKGMEIVSDEGAIKDVVTKVIADNPKIVSDYQKNPNSIKFLLGQVMKETKGKADPKKAMEILNKALNSK